MTTALWDQLFGSTVGLLLGLAVGWPSSPIRYTAPQEGSFACTDSSCLLPAIGSVWDESNPPLLLQKATLSRTQIAFVYAGDLWTILARAEMRAGRGRGAQGAYLASGL